MVSQALKQAELHIYLAPAATSRLLFSLTLQRFKKKRNKSCHFLSFSCWTLPNYTMGWNLRSSTKVLIALVFYMQLRTQLSPVLCWENLLHFDLRWVKLRHATKVSHIWTTSQITHSKAVPMSAHSHAASSLRKTLKVTLVLCFKPTVLKKLNWQDSTITLGSYFHKKKTSRGSSRCAKTCSTWAKLESKPIFKCFQDAFTSGFLLDIWNSKWKKSYKIEKDSLS